MGTPAYMAPEQARDPATVDRSADIYAIGVLLFEVLCGQRPFSGDTLPELLGAHLYQTPEKPSVVHQRKGLPRRGIDWRQIDAIVEKALDKTPSSRFADGLSMQVALAAAFGGRGQWAEASENTKSPDGIARSQAAGKPALRWGLWGGAALVLCSLAVGRVWQLGHRTAELGVRTAAASPVERAAGLLQAALRGGVAERRALLAAIDMVRSRALLPYVEATLRDPAGAVFAAAVPVAAALGTPADGELRQLLAQRPSAATSGIAVELASARLKLGASESAAVLQQAAAGPQLLPALHATLALALAGITPAAALQRSLARSTGASALPQSLRRAVLMQLVLLGDAATEKQLQLQLAAAAASGDAAAMSGGDEALAVYARAKRPGMSARLLHAAQQATGSRRLELAVALADAGDARSALILSPLLRDGTPRIRQRAAGALGSLGAPAAAAAPALTALLDDPDPSVRLTAAAALLAVSPAPVQPAVAAEPSGAAAPSDIAHARG